LKERKKQTTVNRVRNWEGEAVAQRGGELGQETSKPKDMGQKSARENGGRRVEGSGSDCGSDRGGLATQ
jgi:hypothetical protein